MTNKVDVRLFPTHLRRILHTDSPPGQSVLLVARVYPMPLFPQSHHELGLFAHSFLLPAIASRTHTTADRLPLYRPIPDIDSANEPKSTQKNFD